MPELRVLSAGAAQSVVERLAGEFERETACTIKGTFSAVGAIRDRVVAGEPADVIILTAPLIEELRASGHVEAGTRRDLGQVGGGVAVRAGVPPPDVLSEEALRRRLLAGGQVVCPDPATATAGKTVLRALERLGIAAPLAPRLRYFPNGYAAMKWLAAEGGADDTGITQITEILAAPGITYVGPLPGALQVMTTYSAAVATRVATPREARAFIERLTSGPGRAILAQAGYEVGNPA